MKQFVTEESFWELFPEARIGIVVAHGMKPGDQVPPESAAAIAKGLREANEAADAHLNSNTISQNQVVAVWRDAYQRFKTKKGARCSVENLLKRVLKGNPVGSITPSVDIYNTVSLKYALPVGGEDLDAREGDIRLGLTEGGDACRALDADAPDEDFLADAHHELVNRVVHHFLEQYIQAVIGHAAIAQLADVHAGACANVLLPRE